MKIYISIPISNRDLAAQQVTARELAEKLKALGHEPVNPFDTPEAPAEMNEKERYAYYMGEDLKRLLTCDAVFMCKGWNLSRGCCTEEFVARMYGIKVCYLAQSMSYDLALKLI